MGFKILVNGEEVYELPDDELDQRLVNKVFVHNGRGVAEADVAFTQDSVNITFGFRGATDAEFLQARRDEIVEAADDSQTAFREAHGQTNDVATELLPTEDEEESEEVEEEVKEKEKPKTTTTTTKAKTTK